MRIVRVRFSSIFFMSMLVTGNEIHAKVISGLPEGAKFLYSIPTTYYAFIDFVFEHPSFDVIMMGHEIPLFEDIRLEKL